MKPISSSKSLNGLATFAECLRKDFRNTSNAKVKCLLDDYEREGSITLRLDENGVIMKTVNFVKCGS